jgi:hypothetical protein
MVEVIAEPWGNAATPERLGRGVLGMEQEMARDLPACALGHPSRPPARPNLASRADVPKAPAAATRPTCRVARWARRTPMDPHEA